MTIRLEFANEDNVRRAPDGSGYMFNNSTNLYVQLRPLSIDELREEWRNFKSLLRSRMLELFIMPASEVAEQFDKIVDRRSDIKGKEYGLTYASSSGRFTHFQQAAIVKALVEMKVVSATTPHGRPRRRIRDVGGVAGYVDQLSRQGRKTLLKTLLSLDDPLDEILEVSQTNVINDKAIDDFLNSATNTAGSLEVIAKRTTSFFTEQQTQGKENHKRGSGRSFGWAWFAQFLSMRGIWLQPVGNISSIIYLYPRKLGPLASWMAVPNDRRELANRVWSRMRASKSTSSAVILNVFLTMAQSSNTFANNEPAAWPLVYFKEWTLSDDTSTELRSTSANHLFRVICEYYGVNAATHPEAKFFFGNRRLARTGVEAFAWCDHPSDSNTNLVARCLGKPIKSIPPFLQAWAADLRRLLPLFKTATVDNQINELNTWLIFLLQLGEAQAPRSFKDVKRALHVNNLDPEANTYVNFLVRYFSGEKKGVKNRSPSTLAKAWTLAALRDSFSEDSCPFDPRIDRQGKNPPRHGKSIRHPLSREAMQIISRENRRNDFEFARNIGAKNDSLYFYSVINPATKTYESVFFPIAPIIIDVILHTGMRKHQARWLDSGEGDEATVDLINKTYRPNPLRTATKGRHQGFLRICDFIEKGGRRSEVGMYINTNKTGKAYEVPWIDPILASYIQQLSNLQSKYNSIHEPLLARDPGVSELYGYEGDLPRVYPLFRDPRYGRNLPVSDGFVSNYWLALLKHCQPIVTRELGESYRLVSGDRPVFDIHSLRVTMVTVLNEAGVSIEIIQELVGHASIEMTRYYRQFRQGEIHTALNGVFIKLENWPHEQKEALFDEIVKQAVHSDDVDDPVGVAMLQEHHAAKSAPIDVFAHGVCPGGDCRKGGRRLSEGKFEPVFRPRACSRCRFRVTGPAFLNGLVHRLNGLMFEIKQSMERERQANADADAAEDADKPSSHLRALARRESELRDHIVAEWCAELKIIESCKAFLGQIPDEAHLAQPLIPVHPEFDHGHLELTQRHVHVFELVQNLVRSAHADPELQAELPDGAEGTRNDAVHAMLYNNEMSDLLYGLDKDSRRRALDMFGDYVVAAAKNQDQLQAILDGSLPISDVPGLQGVDKKIRATVTAQPLSAGLISHG